MTTVPFEQPLPYKTENGVSWYKIETEAHRPYTAKGAPRKQSEPGIYVDLINA